MSTGLRLYRVNMSRRSPSVSHTNKYIAAADLIDAIAAVGQLYPSWSVWSIAHVGPIDHIVETADDETQDPPLLP